MTLPGVGQHLQDHLQIVSRFQIDQPLTIHGMSEGEADEALRRSAETGSGPFHTISARRGPS